MRRINPHNILDLDQLAIFDVEVLFIKLRQHSVGESTETAYIDNDEVATEMEKDPKIPAAVAQRNATRTFTVDLKKVEVKFPENIVDLVQVTDKIKIKLRFSLKKKFEQNADPKQAAPMKKYMREKFEYLGIKSPEFKVLMKDFIAAHGIPTVLELDVILRDLWSLPPAGVPVCGHKSAGAL